VTPPQQIGYTPQHQFTSHQRGREYGACDEANDHESGTGVDYLRAYSGSEGRLGRGQLVKPHNAVDGNILAPADHELLMPAIRDQIIVVRQAT
jgi:hypothetical protein